MQGGFVMVMLREMSNQRYVVEEMGANFGDAYEGLNLS